LNRIGFTDVFSDSNQTTGLQGIFNDPNFSITEITPDHFKEIKALDGWNGNHHIFIGTDFNSNKFMIKQYIVKDEKTLEKLKKELKN
jgi:hypothetical protein